MEPEYLFTCSVTKAFSPGDANSCIKARGSHFSQYLDEVVKLNELQAIVCQAETGCSDPEILRDLQAKVYNGTEFEIQTKEIINQCLERQASTEDMNKCVSIIQQLKSIKLILQDREQMFLQSMYQLREFYFKLAKEYKLTLKDSSSDEHVRIAIQYIQEQKISDSLEASTIEALYVELLNILELLTSANLNSTGLNCFHKQVKDAEDSLVSSIWLKKAHEIIKNQQIQPIGSDNTKLSIMGQNNNMSFNKFSQFVNEAPNNNTEVGKILPLLTHMKKQVEDFAEAFNAAESLFKNKKQQQSEGMTSAAFANDQKILQTMLEDGSVEQLKQKLMEVVERYKTLPQMLAVEVKQRQHVAQKILVKIEKMSKTEEIHSHESSNMVVEGKVLSIEHATSIKKANCQLLQMKDVYAQSLSLNEAKKKFNVQQFIDLFDTYKDLNKHINLTQSLSEVENFLKNYQHEEFTLLKLSKGWISRINEQMLPLKSFRKDFEQIKALIKKSIFEWNKYESNIRGLEMVLKVREILEGESGEISLKSGIELRDQIQQQCDINFIVKQFENKSEFLAKLEEFIAIRNELTKAASEGVVFERLEEMQRVLQCSFINCNAEKQRVSRMRVAKDKIYSEMKEWNSLQLQGKRVSLARVQATYEVLKTSGLKMDDKKIQIEEIIEQANRIIKFVRRGDSEEFIKEEYNKQNTAIEEVEEVTKESKEIDNWLELTNKSIGDYSSDYETLMDLNGKINKFKNRFQSKPLIQKIKQKSFALLVVLIASNWKSHKKIFGFTQNALNQLFYDAKLYSGDSGERRNKGGLFGVLLNENINKESKILTHHKSDYKETPIIKEVKISAQRAEVLKVEAEELENHCHLEGIFNLDRNEVDNSDEKVQKEYEEVEKLLESHEQNIQSKIEEEVLLAHLAVSEEKCQEEKQADQDCKAFYDNMIKQEEKEVIYYPEEKKKVMQVEYDNFEEIVSIIVNETEGAYQNLIRTCADTIKGLWEKMEERVKKINMASTIKELEDIEERLGDIGCVDLSDLLIEQMTSLQSKKNDGSNSYSQYTNKDSIGSGKKKKKISKSNQNSSLKSKSDSKKENEGFSGSKKKHSSGEKSAKKRLLKDKNGFDTHLYLDFQDSDSPKLEVLLEIEPHQQIAKDHEFLSLNLSKIEQKEQQKDGNNILSTTAGIEEEITCQEQSQVDQQLQSANVSASKQTPTSANSDQFVEELEDKKWFLIISEERFKTAAREMCRSFLRNKNYGENGLCLEIIEKTVQHFISKVIKKNSTDEEIGKIIHCLNILKDDSKLSLELRQSSFSYQCLKAILLKMEQDESFKKVQSQNDSLIEEEGVRKKRKHNEEWLFDSEEGNKQKQKKVIEHTEFVKLESIQFSNTQCNDPQVRELNKLLQSKEMLAQFRRIKESSNRARGIDFKSDTSRQDMRMHTDDEDDDEDEENYETATGNTKKKGGKQAQFSSEDEEEEIQAATPPSTILKYSGDVQNKNLVDPIREDEMEQFVDFCKQQLRITNPLLNGQPALFNPLEIIKEEEVESQNIIKPVVVPLQNEPPVESEQIFRIFNGKVHLRTEASQIPVKAVCYVESLGSSIKQCPVFKYGNTIIQSGESDLLETRQFLLKSFLCPYIISFFGFVESEFIDTDNENGNLGGQIYDSHYQGQITLDTLAQDLKNRERVSIGLWNSATKVYFFHRRILDCNDQTANKIYQKLAHSSSELCFAIIFKHSSIHSSDLESIPRITNPPAMSLQIFKELQCLRATHKNEAESVAKSIQSGSLTSLDKKEEDKSKFKKPLPKYRKDTVLRVYMPIQDDNQIMDRSNPLNILLMPSNSKEVQKSLKKIEEKSEYLNHFRKPTSTKMSINKDAQAEVEAFFQRRLEGKITAKQSLGRQQDIKLKVRQEDQESNEAQEILEQLSGEIDHLQSTLTVSMSRIGPFQENEFDEPLDISNDIEEVSSIIRKQQIPSLQRIINRKTFREEMSIDQDEDEEDNQMQREFLNDRQIILQEGGDDEEYDIEEQQMQQEILGQGEEETSIYRKKRGNQALQNSIAKNRQKLLEFASILDSLRPNTKGVTISNMQTPKLQDIEDQDQQEQLQMQRDQANYNQTEEEIIIQSQFEPERSISALENEGEDNSDSFSSFTIQNQKMISSNRLNNFYAFQEKENNSLEAQQRVAFASTNNSTIYMQDQGEEDFIDDDGLDTPQLSLSKDSYSNPSYSNKVSVTSVQSNKISVSSIPKSTITPVSPFAPSQLMSSFTTFSNNSSVGQNRKYINYIQPPLPPTPNQQFLGKRTFTNAFGNKRMSQPPPLYQRNLFQCNDRIFSQNNDNNFNRVHSNNNGSNNNTTSNSNVNANNEYQSPYNQNNNSNNSNSNISGNSNTNGNNSNNSNNSNNNNRFTSIQQQFRPRLGNPQRNNQPYSQDDVRQRNQYIQNTQEINQSRQPNSRRGIGSVPDNASSSESKIRETQLLDLRNQLDSLLNVIQNKRSYQSQ